jgi:hypothetical protein
MGFVEKFLFSALLLRIWYQENTRIINNLLNTIEEFR